jgi:hypothetical protein
VVSFQGTRNLLSLGEGSAFVLKADPSLISGDPSRSSG